MTVGYVIAIEAIKYGKRKEEYVTLFAGADKYGVLWGECINDGKICFFHSPEEAEEWYKIESINNHLINWANNQPQFYFKADSVRVQKVRLENDIALSPLGVDYY